MSCLSQQSEETKSSDKNGPYGIISAVAISFVVGWGYLLGITFAVTDLTHALDTANDAHGYAIAQVFYDAFKNRYGSGVGGIVCLGVVAVAVFFCGMSSITSNSRSALNLVYCYHTHAHVPSSVYACVHSSLACVCTLMTCTVGMCTKETHVLSKH